jgi:hypothetical protein
MIIIFFAGLLAVITALLYEQFKKILEELRSKRKPE